MTANRNFVRFARFARSWQYVPSQQFRLQILSKGRVSILMYTSQGGSMEAPFRMKIKETDGRIWPLNRLQKYCRHTLHILRLDILGNLSVDSGVKLFLQLICRKGASIILQDTSVAHWIENHIQSIFRHKIPNAENIWEDKTLILWQCK